MNTNQISAKPAADPCEWGRSVREPVSLESLAELCEPRSRDPIGLVQGRYATACGWTLAHAHCRTGSAAAISGYLGDELRFDRAIAEFGIAYAGLAEADCAAFKSAVENIT